MTLFLLVYYLNSSIVDPSTLNEPIYKKGIQLNLKPVKKKAPKGY